MTIVKESIRYDQNEQDGSVSVLVHCGIRPSQDLASMPALIWDQCGAEYLEGSMTQELQTRVDAAVKAGGEINIREHKSAA
jgi:hypothetical protein